VDYLSTLNDFSDAFESLKQDPRSTRKDHLPGQDLNAALQDAGWDAGDDIYSNAAEWYHIDYEYAQHPVSDDVDDVYSQSWRADRSHVSRTTVLVSTRSQMQ